MTARGKKVSERGGQVGKREGAREQGHESRGSYSKKKGAGGEAS